MALNRGKHLRASPHLIKSPISPRNKGLKMPIQLSSRKSPIEGLFDTNIVAGIPALGPSFIEQEHNIYLSTATLLEDRAHTNNSSAFHQGRGTVTLKKSPRAPATKRDSSTQHIPDKNDLEGDPSLPIATRMPSASPTFKKLNEIFEFMDQANLEE